MNTVLVTGSAGLVGSEAVGYYARRGFKVVGIDNDMRREFFGADASTLWVRRRLIRDFPTYSHYELDIRDTAAVTRLFQEHGRGLRLVVHAAAQPSHDWAASNPATDLAVNMNGTSNLLEATRISAPEAVFIYMSTNKVYGDTPNFLPLVETPTRWSIAPSHAYRDGIPETMSVDRSMHSLFGVSKLAADLLVQEYGRYFGMKTVCFRGGCLTGPNHSGTQLHGFLAYLMKCVLSGRQYRIFGYGGKQVRDNIHSADLIRAFDAFFRDPECGAVYNMGGGMFSNCSILEAIAMCEETTGLKLHSEYVETTRLGDHQWWISDCTQFERRYPRWQRKYDTAAILEEIAAAHAGPAVVQAA